MGSHWSRLGQVATIAFLSKAQPPTPPTQLPMMKSRFLALAALCAGSMACSNTNATKSVSSSSAPGGRTLHDVKTTAYTHSESDHIVYGVKNAAGGNLKYGSVRSAAADWSVYPVGTQFQIDGDAHVYEVDDYGSALVGTATIDLYKPSRAAMNDWGSRRVSIHVIKWGSFLKSLAIMKPRERKSPHVRAMVGKIERVIKRPA